GRLLRVDELGRADEVGHRIDRADLILLCQILVWSGRAVGIDDTLGEQVRHRLSMLRLVRAVDIVESAILTDEHDDVLDRGCGRRCILVTRLLSGGPNRDSHLPDPKGREPECESFSSFTFHQSPPEGRVIPKTSLAGRPEMRLSLGRKVSVGSK